MTDRFDAWEPELPPEGFADRVMAAERERRAREARRRRLVGGGAAIGALAAAAVVVIALRSGAPIEGAAEAAAARREVALDGAVAVLEPGASIRWRRGEIEQRAGDVFYRVDRGAPRRVVTPAGTVEVLGTCFRVRLRPGGAPEIDATDGTAAPPARDTSEEGRSMKNAVAKVGAGVVVGAVLTVGVYEGRVRVSSAGEARTLAAGETATFRGDAERSGRGGAIAADHPEPSASASEAERAYATANRSLVDNIQALNRRMATIEDQKKALQKQLDEANVALARAGGEGGKRTRSEFDLTPEDWKPLAENGTVKFRVPCFRKAGWDPSPEALQQLGLAPDDAPALKDVYRRSNDRMWSVLEPLCAAAVGSEAIARKIGPDTCIHLVVDASRDADREATSEAMRRVGEVRAGLVAPPADPAREHPVFTMFHALTGELGAFERDLAQSFGPEEAHRLAYADGMCAGHSTFGGPGPRGKK